MAVTRGRAGAAAAGADAAAAVVPAVAPAAPVQAKTTRAARAAAIGQNVREQAVEVDRQRQDGEGDDVNIVLKYDAPKGPTQKERHDLAKTFFLPGETKRVVVSYDKLAGKNAVAHKIENMVMNCKRTGANFNIEFYDIDNGGVKVFDLTNATGFCLRAIRFPAKKPTARWSGTSINGGVTIQNNCVKAFIYTGAVVQSDNKHTAAIAVVVVTKVGDWRGVDREGDTMINVHAIPHNLTTGVAETLAVAAGVKAAKAITVRDPNCKVVVVTSDKDVNQRLVRGERNQANNTKPIGVLHSIIRKDVPVGTNNILFQFESEKHEMVIAACRRAILTNASTGDANLFPNVEQQPPKLVNGVQADMGGTETYTQVREIAKLIMDSDNPVDMFQRLRKYHTRRFVPDESKQRWAILVTNQLHKIINAPTQDEHDRALYEFLILPTMYLPCNAKNSKIAHNIATNQPFHVDLQPRQPGQQKQRTRKEKLEQSINVCVHECNIRKAVNRMLSFAEEEIQQDARQAMPGADAAATAAPGQPTAEEMLNDWKGQCEKLKEKHPSRRDEDKFDVENPQGDDFEDFGGAAVIGALRRINARSATAIDAWTRDLLEVVFEYQPPAADMFGTVLRRIALSRPTKVNPVAAAGDDDEAPAAANQARAQQQRPAAPTPSPFWRPSVFSEKAMDVVLAGRLIGITKANGDVRPVAIGCFLIKMLGTLLLMRSHPARIENSIFTLADQYAIRVEDGAQRVIHTLRKSFRTGKAILRFDIRNGFNSAKRKQMLKALKDMKMPRDVIEAYYTLYGRSSKLVVYGPDGATMIIDADEGCRQGDALSAFFFCATMHKLPQMVRERLKKEFPELTDEDIEIMIYMDDVSAAVPPRCADAAARIIQEVLQELGFTIAKDKCSMTCAEAEFERCQHTFTVTKNETEEFKVLGGVLNGVYENINAKIVKRNELFFNTLQMLNLHAAVKHAITYFSGWPKLMYYCKSTPPEHGRLVVRRVQQLMNQAFADIINVNVNDIPLDVLHCTSGGAVPDYVSNYDTLFNNTLKMVEDKAQKAVRCWLTKSVDSTALTRPTAVDSQHRGAAARAGAAAATTSTATRTDTAAAALEAVAHLFGGDGGRDDDDGAAAAASSSATRDAGGEEDDGDDQETEQMARQALMHENRWAHPFALFRTPQRELTLSSSEYTIAMAMRLGLIPRGLYPQPVVLTCPIFTSKEPIDTPARLIAHAIKCYACSQISYVQRHDWLKHTLTYVAMRYGITATVEPGYFNYADNTDEKARPDIHFTSPRVEGGGVVTDVTVVAQQDGVPGKAAAQKAINKRERHFVACKKMDCVFVPFVVESTGFFDSSCRRLARALLPMIHYAARRQFARELLGAAATSLARTRAMALRNMLTRTLLNV